MTAILACRVCALLLGMYALVYTGMHIVTQKCLTNLYQDGPLSSPSPPSHHPPPPLFSIQIEETHTHTDTQNMGASQPEIIHLDICACTLLRGEIGEGESGKKKG